MGKRQKEIKIQFGELVKVNIYKGNTKIGERTIEITELTFNLFSENIMKNLWMITLRQKILDV